MKYGYTGDVTPPKPSHVMSHDRVHFTVPNQHLLKSAIRDVLNETMGISVDKMAAKSRLGEDLHIICRPSQFARFIILRFTKYNEPNNMACLRMELVLPPKVEEAIDVSRNPNTAGPSGKNTD